jgi:Glycosyltransferase family 28 C-terminal domain
LTTISKINSSTKETTKILLAPLDWGLGHATRCIPIVKELLRLECEVIIAAKGAQKAVLEQEFPFLTFVALPGYNVKYGKNRALTLLKIVVKIPEILTRIKAERAWLKAFLEREKPIAVISDNRYGMHNKGVISVFVTHQLLIRTPFGQLGDRILQRLQYRLLRKFSVCWVPDLENEHSLAGELSHPKKLPSIPVRYIGILSRFEKKEKTTCCDLLILLSGPEPQRTIFEKIILDQLGSAAANASRPGKTILVRGLPGEPPGDRAVTMPPGLVVHDHLPAEALNGLVCGAGLVVCRPGYSSVMDLLKLQKKCIFVPTPGQTEQEYLGNYLAGRQMAVCFSQDGFSLDHAIASAENFSFRSPELEENGLLQKTIGEWVSSLGNGSAE